MSKKLIHKAGALAASLMLSGYSFAGGGGFAGATEFTQIANNIQLAASYAQELQQTATQLQQYANMLQNTNNISNQTWGNVQSELLDVARIAQQGNALAYSSVNMASQFENTFKGYQFPANFNYQTEYGNWSRTTRDTLKSALEAAGLQSQQFATEEGVLNNLRSMSQSATGQMQAIQVGSQIAEQQVQQLQKLRQLMMLQMQSQNTYMAAQQNENDSAKAARHDAVRYQDPRRTYRYQKGGSQ